MKLPIEEVNNYLNTTEMNEAIQEILNDGDKVIHLVGDIEITAYHDKELQVLWEFVRKGDIIADGVETENLQRDLKGFL